MFLQFNKYFHPEEVVDKGELGKEEMITLLGEDDVVDDKIDLEPKDKDKDKKLDTSEEDDDKNKEGEEEDDDLKELEDELEEPDDEKLELTTPVRRREILAKYPKLFKDFPYLEKAYYREQQFTQIVPTIDDAKLAVTKAEVLDKFEADLGSGNLEPALKAAKQSGEASFNKLVDNYLPNLAKVDKDAYLHVIGNIIKTTTINMINEGKSSGDEDLEAAAKILHKFVFGKTQIENPSNLSKPDAGDDKDKKINEREQKYLEQRFEESRDTLNTKINNVLKGTIAANIDPKESMTEYVRKTAVRECQEKLNDLLEGDRRLGILVDRLWMQAAKENFSQASVDKIKSAWLSRAKTLLPTVIKQARNEALKGLGKRVREEVEEEPSSNKKGPLPAGRSTSPERNTSGKTDREKAKSIPSNVSSRDFLMQD